MKRSEMLESIENMLMFLQDVDQGFDLTTIGEDVLTLVEELGMLPPNVCLSNDKDYDSVKHAAYFHMGKDLHHWEPENE